MLDSVFAQNRGVIQVLLMYTSIVLASVRALFRSRSEQAIVELALRQQLTTYARQQTKPRLTPLDRTFWVALSRIWPRWKNVLCIVQPETVVRWHQKGFALYWRSISMPGPGRPLIAQELQALIRRLASENDWRARKIQAELEKLGFTISLATVSRYLPKRRPDLDRRQCWTTFLRNHRDAIAAMDFLVVPTAHFSMLYVWFIIEHGRRRILIHDNDTIFSDRVVGSPRVGGLHYRYAWQEAA